MRRPAAILLLALLLLGCRSSGPKWIAWEPRDPDRAMEVMRAVAHGRIEGDSTRLASEGWAWPADWRTNIRGMSLYPPSPYRFRYGERLSLTLPGCNCWNNVGLEPRRRGGRLELTFLYTTRTCA